MKIDSITLNLDTITFTFARHEAELRRRATEWFAEALAKATPQERQHLAERVFVDGEELGSVYATCRFYLSLCRTLRVRYTRRPARWTSQRMVTTAPRAT